MLDLRYEARDIEQIYHLATENRPVVRGEDQGLERCGAGPTQAEVGHDAKGAQFTVAAGKDCG